jgi:hypothetical protein
LFKTPNFKSVLSVLNHTIYSLTLDSAVQIRKGNTPRIVQAYVLGKDMGVLESSFQRTRKNPDLIVYPSDHFKFLKQQVRDNIFLVSDYDLFVDLLINDKLNEALFFAKNYKLFKTSLNL